MPVLLAIDDDRSVLVTIEHALRATDLTVWTANGAQAAREHLERGPDVVILDVMLPDESGLDLFSEIHRLDPKLPVIFVTADATSETAIAAMKAGALDYLLKPIDVERLREVVGRALEIRRLMRVPVDMPPQDSNDVRDELIGRSAVMQEVYKAIGRVAAQDVTVLIRGESGTGKELVARAIYQHSPRSGDRFLAVNCAALTETLLESELFGHEKGSFTGADRRRIGKFEQCSGGTIFLDEVGDMSPLVQSKVLRVLQEQRFERVGGTETVAVDVRVIAATNRDLEKMVAQGSFREDLYYRLNGFTISLPPLRERGDDLLLLVEHGLRLCRQQLKKEVIGVAPEALHRLVNYRWPGNVRELQSVLRQAVLQTTGSVVLPEFLPDFVRDERPPPDAPASARGGGVDWQAFLEQQMARGTNNLYAECRDKLDREIISAVLRATHGNQSRAAEILGITRGSLRTKIRALGITVDYQVSTPETPVVPIHDRAG
jgi:two-component system nitrogen regulation response regulator GlnG